MSLKQILCLSVLAMMSMAAAAKPKYEVKSWIEENEDENKVYGRFRKCMNYYNYTWEAVKV